jgi:4-hydroxybenzoate polyprenyltransferase
MMPFIKALRPHQWIKNLFVLAALIFSKHVFDPEYLLRALLAFVSYWFISSAVYLFNDIRDRKSDRNHPEKRHRPIASGALGVSTAFGMAFFLALIALWLAFGVQLYFGFILIIYMLFNIAYSLGLKNVVILDVMIIASGFLLRAIGGALAIEVDISSWFILCTMLLALFLGFVKRRQELTLLENQAGQHRQSLKDYSAPFLDQVIAVMTSGSLLSYALYTMSPDVTEKLGAPYLSLTIPFVIYGLLRYLYLVYNKGQGGDTATTLLRDFPLQLACLFWVITLSAVLYF